MNHPNPLLLNFNFFKRLNHYLRQNFDLIEYKDYLPLTLIAVVITMYFVSIWIFSVNFPSWDDYDAILNFLNRYLDKSFLGRLSYLFAQHNEHRILFCRLASISYLFLFKVINFKALNFIGDISLFGIYLLLINMVDKNSDNKYWSFLAIALLLFSHGFWETSYMAMGSLCNLWVLFFAMLAVHFLSKQNLFWSIFFAVFATFTSGGGICVFVAGIFMCISQEKYKNLLIWIFAMGMALSGYLYHYVKPIGRPDLMFAFQNPIHSIFYLFSSMGSYLGHLIVFAIPEEKNSGLLTSVWLGFCVFSLILYLTVKKYHKVNPRIYFFLIYLLVLSSTIVLARSAFGFDQALGSRYMIISVLYLICAYISLADLKYFQNKKKIFCFAFVYFVLNISWFLMLYTNYENILMTTKSLFVTESEWRDLTRPDYPDPSRAWLCLAESQKKGIYDFSKEVAALKH